MSDVKKLAKLESYLRTIQAVAVGDEVNDIRKNYLEADPEFKDELFELIKALAGKVREVQKEQVGERATLH